jgi:hypothetical protein
MSRVKRGVGLVLAAVLLPGLWITGTASPASATTTGLDNDASQWGVYVPSGQTAQWSVRNVGSPSQDGNALQVALNGGTPYVNVRAYRNLPANPGATALHLSTSFYYSPSQTPVQAIEFLMEKYQGGSRWTWKLQWEYATLGGVWRISDGSSWQSTGVQQSLAANAWHSLDLYGDIFNGQVHYVGFTVDGTWTGLNGSFAAGTGTGSDRLVVGAQLDANGSASPYQVTIDKTTLNVPTGSATDLDNSASAWGKYIDPPTSWADAAYSNVSSPSLDGTAFLIDFRDGTPYVGVHAYRTLASAPAATMFQMDLSFRFSPSATPVQALEFPMDKWLGGVRYEWGMQWEHGQYGGAWRIYSGQSWDLINVSQSLSADTWHTFRLIGDIRNGQVHYIGFECDSLAVALNNSYASKTDGSSDRLAATFQLDSNGTSDPYRVYLDRYTMQWG